MKTKQHTGHVARTFGWIIGFCVLFFFFYGCTSPANDANVQRLFADINSLASNKKNSIEEIPENVKRELCSECIQKFPEARSKMEAAVREALPYYESDIRRFETIAGKYEEMKRLGGNVEYLDSVSNHEELFGMYASGIRLQKARLELILDPGIIDRDTLISRSRPIDSKITELANEIARLEQATRNGP